MANMLKLGLNTSKNAVITADEIGLNTREEGIVLPAGASALAIFNGKQCNQRISRRKIIYEDNHILVAVKPQNMPSQEDESKDPDILSILKNYLKETYDKPGDAYLGLVHRLDRVTGGVMVFAKTSKAAARLSEAIREGEFEKLILRSFTIRPKKNRRCL